MRFLGSSAVASKRTATASGCGGPGPSAASPLLTDALRHRLRRASLHPTPRRSPLAHQRQAHGSRERRPQPAVTRSTPFFSSLLRLDGGGGFAGRLEREGLTGRVVLQVPREIPPGACRASIPRRLIELDSAFQKRPLPGDVRL